MNNNFMLHTSQPLIKPENTFVLDRKLISIHSVDRDYQKWPNSNQFGIDLGVAFSNVQSMRLVNFAVPTNNYTFSTAYQNTKMSFTYTVYYPLKFLGMGGSGNPDGWLRMRDTLSALFGSSYAAPSDVTFEYWSDSSIGGSDEWTELPWTGGPPSVSAIGSWPNGNVKPDYFTGYGRIKWSPSEFSITIPEGSYSPTNLTETIESLMNKEWSEFKSKPRNGPADYGRQIAIGLIPIGIWFTWWASMGQIDGILHPRDIDPGNLFLKGGYIGDRTSPSNFWVFLLGAGPVILIGCLWWHHFQKIGWPINLAFLILVARVAALAIHLSVSPNLLRLVFKIGWDMLLGLVIYAVMLLFILYKGYSDKKAGKTDSIFVI